MRTLQGRVCKEELSGRIRASEPFRMTNQPCRAPSVPSRGYPAVGAIRTL
jgi:hypothetical protein